MIALQVEDIKIFMNKLFKDTTFDDFEVISIDITQLIKFSVDGALHLSHYDTEEQALLADQRYVKWLDLKQTIFSLIKGAKSPSSIKIIFAVSNKSKLNIVLKSNSSFQPDDVHGFYLNVLYETNHLKVVTGTNYKLFTLDKSVESYFDDSIFRFFLKHEIPISKMDT